MKISSSKKMSFLYVTVEYAILIASMTADFPELFSPIIAFTPLLNCKVIPSSSKALKFLIVSFLCTFCLPSFYIKYSHFLKLFSLSKKAFSNAAYSFSEHTSLHLSL